MKKGKRKEQGFPKRMPRIRPFWGRRNEKEKARRLAEEAK
jgi:hypothetical protein